jgi:hypothetical protein
MEGARLFNQQALPRRQFQHFIATRRQKAINSQFWGVIG